ncbi:MAG TPA: YchF/TatD family DNA exonuclease [Blastocatellia bacterium]|jgi:TatD DNase family protein|nr:YchF/TatD family DNA exonuclease [Blastocatellia bacterium]
MYIDSHAHIEMDQFDSDRDQVIRRALDAGVEIIVDVGNGDVSADSHSAALRLAETHPFIYTTVGVHPHEARLLDDELYARLKDMSSHPKVIAWGEIGLDYHYDNSPREAQRDAFRRQLSAARERNLPAVIHTREAEADTLQILREEWKGSNLPGIVHCFTGTRSFAEEAIRLGFYISFSGVVTFKNAGELRDSAKHLPIEKLLIETDSPFLAPIPFRGRRNEPAYVVETARAIAELRNLAPEDIGRITSLNFKRLFKLGEWAAPEPRGQRNIVYRIRDSLYVNLTNRCTSLCAFCSRVDEPIASGYHLGLTREEEPTASDVIASIGDPASFREVVFCGYGEPTLKLAELKEIARHVKARGGRTRLDTIGHGSLIHGRDIAPELAGLIDEISMSLNAPTREQYEKIVRSDWPDLAFDAALKFASSAAASGIRVIMSVVRLPNLDIEACRAIAEEAGAEFRVRELVGMTGTEFNER